MEWKRASYNPMLLRSPICSCASKGFKDLPAPFCLASPATADC